MSTQSNQDPDPYTRERKLLIESLESGRCVPLLGAGACHDRIPLGGAMAREWAERYGYPMHDPHHLPAVMQYVATMHYSGDATQLKEHFVEQELLDVPPPEFSAPSQIHAALAGFPLPLYVTTNYDRFMYLALDQAGKHPEEYISPWFDIDPDIKKPRGEPTPAKPWVYHLHGHQSEPRSLVLTEDDYIDFLVQLARRDRHRDAGALARPIAPYVLGRLRDKRLLFVGYSLRDWTFLVLFRTLLHGLPHSQHRSHVSVQVDPDEPMPDQAKAFLRQYMADQRIHVFWESAQQFTTRLKDWQKGTGR